ncbi:MAG TPA: protein-L-isoaspartate O-methyltransferase [Stellaceae bacterium]|nr:protein-L-isoaspartate O-methyltransferase [Stellaceae bacterium]
MINEPAARLNMVEGQLRTNKVTDEAVLEGFLTTPRERFVPANLRGIAYVDDDVPLGNGRFLVEPLVLARLLQLAEIGKNDKVLEIGSATGYATAILAKIAASVVAVESDPQLAATARANLQALGIANAQLQDAPLTAGWRAGAPYNVILINGAVGEVPAAISDQLAEGGRLVTVTEGSAGPVEARCGSAVLMTRAEGKLSNRSAFDATVESLPGFARRPAFVF